MQPVSSGPATASRKPVFVFLGTWTLLLVSGRSGLFRDPGTFWHVLTGERIFQVGFFRTDWMTFTFAGQHWIPHQWLGECLMALLHLLGGLDALLLATAGGLALTFAWLFHRLVGAGISAPWAVMVLGLCFMASSHHFHVRPQILSIPVFAWMFARLIDYQAGRIGLRGLLPLLPLFMVWANSHGAVVGGLATFALAIAGWTAGFLLGRESPLRNLREAAALVGLLLACAGSAFLNPYGRALPESWGAILGSPALPVWIFEHASLLRTRTWQVLPVALLYLGALAATLPRWPGVVGLLPAVWLVLSFDRIRHAPFFAVAVVLVLGELLRRGRLAARLHPSPLASATTVAAFRFPRLPLVMAGLALAMGICAHRLSPAQPRLVKLDPALWPVELVPRLRSLAAELPAGAAVLNDMQFGAFVVYHAPGLRVMVDDRWELFGDAFMLAYFGADAAWFRGQALRHDARLAMAEPGGALHRYLQQETSWKQVASTSAAVLFHRSGPGS